MVARVVYWTKRRERASFPLLQKGKRDGCIKGKRGMRRVDAKTIKNLKKKRPVSEILAIVVLLASCKSEESHLDRQVGQCSLLSKVDISFLSFEKALLNL